jgi:hypothetical protein
MIGRCYSFDCTAMNTPGCMKLSTVLTFARFHILHNLVQEYLEKHHDKRGADRKGAKGRASKEAKDSDMQSEQGKSASTLEDLRPNKVPPKKHALDEGNAQAASPAKKARYLP